MEIGSVPVPCVAYDLEGGRLVVLVGPETHEIPVRPQVHGLVRHMAVRNAESGGSPVLCSHDELMHAVWGEEPMHTHGELAKLVWELRRQLEPIGATEVVVNERRRGYRLVTCPKAQAAVETETAPATPTEGATREAPSPPRGRPRGLWIAVGLAVLAIALGGGTAIVLATHLWGSGTTETSTNPELEVFVDRVENVLEQSAAGRREIRAALTAGFDCSISPDEAARRISSVADNRQSVLEQLGTLAAPTPQAEEIVTRLQRALQQSIEADRHYRDGFFEVQAGARCPLPSNPGFRLAAKSDRLASAAKREFVRAFDPLAREFDRPLWSATGF